MVIYLLVLEMMSDLTRATSTAVREVQEAPSVITGVHLDALTAGSVLEVETKSRRYEIEYVDGDEILIWGHPQLCPTPTPAQLCGSRKGIDEFERRYVGCGMRLVFKRPDDPCPITTSEVTEIRIIEGNPVAMHAGMPGRSIRES